MTTTKTAIGEHDMVTLRRSVDGWPGGTKGTVISVFPTHRWVEVGDGQGESLDIVSARPEELRLVWKAPDPDRAADVDQFPRTPSSS